MNHAVYFNTTIPNSFRSTINSHITESKESRIKTDDKVLTGKLRQLFQAPWQFQRQRTGNYSRHIGPIRL